jgi:hypothetical protein
MVNQLAINKAERSGCTDLLVIVFSRSLRTIRKMSKPYSRGVGVVKTRSRQEKNRDH